MKTKEDKLNQTPTNGIVKGYKVVNPDYTSKHGDIYWEAGKTYIHEGGISLCSSGFHFCQKAQHCFNYYDFSPKNHVLEILAHGRISHGEGKSVCSKIEIIRELSWGEVLIVANEGLNNTGYRNSGNRNSGNWNSGNWNSGYRNSGNWNSGNWNSGNWNSGDRNSGDWNSGDWNSGYRNSGDSNSGAFCTDENPSITLFNKPCKMTVKEWENHPAYRLMNKITPTIWVQWEAMSKTERERYPLCEASGGYTKSVSMKEAWANFWHNLTDEDKNHFTSLPNFDAKVFEEITGILIK